MKQRFCETTHARMLEFDKVLDLLTELAFTENAKERCRELMPSMKEAEVLHALKETTEARVLLEKCGNPPLTSMEGQKELLESARKGDCLGAEQLERVSILLTAVKRLKDYLNRGKTLEIGMAYYEENLDAKEELIQEINAKIRGGRVDDYATKLLKSLRDEIERTENKIRETAERVIRAQKDCMAEDFCTMRAGRVCVPVKKDCRMKVRGSVIDKSSTGNTVFIEPEAVAKYTAELQELKLDEENEERRILYTLTALVADHAEGMEQNEKTIEKLDFFFAKGKLSLLYDGSEPKINLERRIKITNGRHPLMKKEKNVPLNFSIEKGTNGVVITGPNTGGKTVAIKTIALNALMAQCGLHVACEKADLCMNNRVLCDIGDGQNLSENLSTFSAHITNILDILKKADEESLVIMDELGSGTDPTEGMGIAIAILRQLKRSGVLFLVTTHYPEVKDYADSEEGVVNARMTFDKETLQPLYQLVLGEAGESCAFYIAERLGMPRSMLSEAALAAYGTPDFENREKEKKTERKAGQSLPQQMKQDRGANAFTEKKERGTKLQKKKEPHTKLLAEKFHLGDSVMLYPDKKIGIVCEPVNEQGVLRIQVAKKKIYVNHKRVKLYLPAAELYPPDYDFSIIFDSVENRKLSHDMDRKYVEGKTLVHEEKTEGKQ